MQVWSFWNKTKETESYGAGKDEYEAFYNAASCQRFQGFGFDRTADVWVLALEEGVEIYDRGEQLADGPLPDAADAADAADASSQQSLPSPSPLPHPGRGITSFHSMPHSHFIRRNP